MKKRRLHLIGVLTLALFLLLAMVAAPAAAAPEARPANELAALGEPYYQSPPGTMPVIFLAGSEWEMGYQYGQQAGGYIEMAKDGLWASLLTRYSNAAIMEKLAKYEEAVKRLPRVDYVQILKGMAAGAKAAGFNVSYEDVLALNYQVEMEWLPHPSSCTNLAAWGKATAGGQTIVGSNYDFPWGNGYPYMVAIVAYPAKGNAFIAHATAGKLADNFVMNDKGLVYVSNKGPNARPEDIGFGLTDFILGPYLAMTCATADQAKDLVLSTERTNGINCLIADKDGKAYVIEATAALAKARSAGDFGERDYLVVTNHFINPALKPAQKPWEPKEYYPSSWYRYLTAQKYLEDGFGKVDAAAAMGIMASTDYWDGQTWQRDAGWTGNTVNRFSAGGPTLASIVAIPAEKTVYLCTGNPGTIAWGGGAPGQTGQYVKLQLADSPRASADAAGKAAFGELLSVARSITALENRSSAPVELLTVRGELDRVREQYWQGVRYLVRAGLAGDQVAALALAGKAATAFNQAQAGAKYLRDMLSKR